MGMEVIGPFLLLPFVVFLVLGIPVAVSIGLSCVPFLAAEFVVLLLIAYVPAVTLTIPRWVGFIG